MSLRVRRSARRGGEGLGELCTKGLPELSCQALTPTQTLGGTCVTSESEAEPCPDTPLVGDPCCLPVCPVGSWAEGRDGPREEGVVQNSAPSRSTAGCVGIRLSMKKLSLSFLRRSRMATMSLSLLSGTTFLSQVRPVGAKDKIMGSRQRLSREKSLTKDGSPGS